jgi:CDP-diacylglycerol--serine O-phosphatidyltransferase
MKEEQDTTGSNNPLDKYFTGVPSPLAAGLCLLPMVISFMLDDHVPEMSAYLRSPALTGFWMLVAGGLAVSHVPTFSSKQMRVPYRMKVPALGVFGLLVAGLINDPWPTLTLLALAYIVSIPFGILHYARKEKALSQGENDPEDSEHDD